MHEVVRRRTQQRDELISAAREYAAKLARRLPIERAIVAGSVARGDFNVWSDIDVVVIAPGLPPGSLHRASALLEDAPAWLQPIGFTPDEYAAELRRGNRLVTEAEELGVVVWEAG